MCFLKIINFSESFRPTKIDTFIPLSLSQSPNFLSPFRNLFWFFIRKQKLGIKACQSPSFVHLSHYNTETFITDKGSQRFTSKIKRKLGYFDQELLNEGGRRDKENANPTFLFKTLLTLNEF